MIEAFITNLGKYNEGELFGEYLKLPATKEDVQALLSRIGVDGVSYEELIITDYKTDITGLFDCLGEYESIDELNYLTSLLSDMKDRELEKFEAVLACGEYTSSVKNLINLAQNLDCYDYHPGIEDEESLGRFFIDELSMIDVPEYLEPYFDYKAYGRDESINAGGVFTDGGYIENNHDTFTEYYSSREDIPDEHRIFAYPTQPERKSEMDNTKTIPIKENEHVKELMGIMETNNLPGAKDLAYVIKYVGAMEQQLDIAAKELKAMRQELAAMREENSQDKAALKDVISALETNNKTLRNRVEDLKEHIVNGCKNAVAAFKEKGLSALRNVAEYFKIRPSLEALRDSLDKSILRDDTAIIKIEAISAEYHEAGRHLKNVGRFIVGKDAILEAKPSGKLAKAMEAPYRADQACCMAMRSCVSNAIRGLERLENTERKPSIMKQYADAAKEAAAANAALSAPAKSAPARVER
jgi:antirestriction protein/regulator of replication initiation timing